MDEGAFDNYFESQIHVIDGVARGFLIMIVPLIIMGVAVGLGIRMMSIPARKIGGI